MLLEPIRSVVSDLLFTSKLHVHQECLCVVRLTFERAICKESKLADARAMFEY